MGFDDIIKTNAHSGFIVSYSGGKDSTACLLLALKSG